MRKNQRKLQCETWCKTLWNLKHHTGTHWTAPGVTKISTKETASRNKIIKKIEAETSKKSDPLVIIIREANVTNTMADILSVKIQPVKS